MSESNSPHIYKESDDNPDTDAKQGELLPAFDLTTLPSLEIPGQFISKHANVADYAIASVNSKHSRRTYESRLRLVAGILGYDDLRQVPWENLRYQHVLRLREYLYNDAKKSYASVNAMLAAIRATAKAAFNLERMSADDLGRIMNVKMIRGSRELAGREVKLGELEALVRVCVEDTSPAGARDAVILGLLYICGLRRMEVAALDAEMYNADDGIVRVIGKGNKERLVYPDIGTQAAFEDWLRIRGRFDGPLLLAIRKNGAIDYQNGRLSDQAIYKVIIKLAKQAGVNHCSPHDFRRSFATELLRRDKDLLTVQRLLGHTSAKTTERYDRRAHDEDRRATEVLHLPYTTREDPGTHAQFPRESFDTAHQRTNESKEVIMSFPNAVMIEKNTNQEESANVSVYSTEDHEAAELLVFLTAMDGIRPQIVERRPQSTFYRSHTSDIPSEMLKNIPTVPLIVLAFTMVLAQPAVELCTALLVERTKSRTIDISVVFPDGTELTYKSTDSQQAERLTRDLLNRIAEPANESD